jgi:hypothetical protein
MWKMWKMWKKGQLMTEPYLCGRGREQIRRQGIYWERIGE